MSPERVARGGRVITVGASSKKAGKSTTATYLIEHLNAPFGLKVSSDTHAPTPVVTDPDLLSSPGTDTGAMLNAGAEKVLWVNASPARLGTEIRRAIGMLPDDGALIVEGNCSVEHLSSDFTVFVMSVPFERFKESAWPALAKADMVLVDMSRDLNDENPRNIASELARSAPGARAVFFYDDEGRREALADTVKLIRSR